MQYPNQESAFIGEGKICIEHHYYEEMQCCRDGVAYKSCFPDERKHVCFGENENSHGNIKIPTNREGCHDSYLSHNACQNNPNMIFFLLIKSHLKLL